MASAYSAFLGRFTINTYSRSFSVGANAMNMNVANYYLCGYSSESTLQFCETMQTKIRAISDQGTANVSYNFSTERCTIALTTARNVTFTDGIIGQALGFSEGFLSSSATHVGDINPRFTWQPSRPPSDYPVSQSVVWQPVGKSSVFQSIDGSITTVERPVLYKTQISYSLLPDEDVITPSTGTTYKDFQQFFVDVICKGQPMRYIWNRSSYGSTDYAEGIFYISGSEESGIGSFDQYAAKHFDVYMGLFDVRIPMVKYI